MVDRRLEEQRLMYEEMMRRQAQEAARPGTSPRLQPQPSPGTGPRLQPQPKSVDPVWDSISSWFGDNFTTEGRVRKAAEEARTAEMQPRPGTMPRLQPPLTPAAAALKPGNIPGDGSDGWTVGDILGWLGGGGGQQTAAGPALPETAPIPTGRPEEAAAAAEAAPPAQPTAAEELAYYRDFINKNYPQLNTANPKQDKADARADSEKERTRLLAQLALAGGVTAMGGGSWKNLAAGFGAAGAVYDDGFVRYQKALQESADRFAQDQDRQFEFETAKTDAAVGLYSKAQDRSAAHQEKRLEIIAKSFDAEGKLLEGNELTGIDPEAVKDYMLRRERGMREGRYIPPTIDVTA